MSSKTIFTLLAASSLAAAFLTGPTDAASTDSPTPAPTHTATATASAGPTSSALPSTGPSVAPSSAPSASPSGAPSAAASATAPGVSAGATGALPAAAGPPADGVADYEKLIKGADKQPGLFTVWRKDGRAYIELRDDQLDTDYLEHVVPANGLGGFGFHGGQQFEQDARIVRFHQSGKSIVMIWPHTRFLAKPGTPLATAVRESTADSVEAMLPVAAENKNARTRVVDLSPLLGDLLDLGNHLSDAAGAEKNPAGGYHLDPSRTYFGPSKAFPKNVIIEADQTFASAKPDAINTVPDARFVQMRVKYNLSQIVSSPDYMPRLYDDRVGYWEDPHVAFDDDSRRDNGRWYVLRWDVRATDPMKLSAARNPIVFYLDSSIPVEYRPAVRDGVLEWNKAFARIGISDAVVVKDRPADATWDPDDIRYSVIRWVTDAPSEFGAEAQIVWDPRTGQIFRGGILLDSNLGRYAKFSEQNLLARLSLPSDTIVPDVPRARFSPTHDETAYAAGEALEAAFGATALALLGIDRAPDAYVRERIKSVTMHEVGHDFGLSHNFMSHNAYTERQLKSKAFTQANGVAASVMDYSPINLWPKGMSQGAYFPPTIGPYDYHVIHWGYAPIRSARSPQEEVPVLARWASASRDPKYAFAGDEDVQYDGHAVDPRTAPFVLSNTPLAWCGTQLELTKRLVRTLDRRFPQPQQPWSDERAAFLALFSRYTTCATTMTHYIAGEYLTRGRVGDPGVRTALEPVARREESRAYAMLATYVFADNAWPMSRQTLKRLTYTEYMPFANFGYDPPSRHDVPVVSLVGALQNRVLGYMYSPLVLQRLADLPTKAKPGETMTLADLFAWTQTAIAGDISSGRLGGTQIHRNLQRRYARLLALLATAPPAGTPLDAQALARYELSALASDVERGLRRGSPDLQTRAHLTGMQVDIKRALEARAVLPVAVR